MSLIHAVERAKPEDESRSVEWKSGFFDVAAAPASFAIARAILGLANRPVDVSQASFEGVGYVLVGVEPSSLRGRPVPDSANLLNSLGRFTGHGWPLWEQRSVSVNGIEVLVVTVESPRAGDRIALLHKSYQPPKSALVEKGTVFVRHPGATDRASRADMEMLQDRLLSGSEVNAAATRAEQRAQQTRVLVADLVHAANQWANTMQILVLASAKTQWSQRNWMEWVDTDSGRAMATNALLISQNARKIRLLIGDGRILEPLEYAEHMLKDNAKAFDGIHGPGPSSGEARSKAYRHINGVKSAFAVVERAAIGLLNGGSGSLATTAPGSK